MPNLIEDLVQYNDRGHLVWGGVDLAEVAAGLGTPFYAYDGAALDARLEEIGDSLARAYPGETRPVYAAKAFLSLAMVKLVERAGWGIDVVSGGELATVLAAGFPPERIVFHGNNKREEALKTAVDCGIGRLVIDNADELARAAEVAADLNRVQPVLIRVTPGIEAHTHSYIKTGQEDSKFGFDLGNGQAARAVAEIDRIPSLELKGLHAHIGSQIFELESFALAAERVLTFAREMNAQLKWPLEELDLGGGLGVRYTVEDDPAAVGAYTQTLSDAVTAFCEREGMPLPRLMIEPGRSVVAEAAVTVYRVGMVKEVPGVRRYVAVDGGMADNPRPMLYDAEYTAVLVNRPGVPEKASEKTAGDELPVTLAGKFCESGDVLIEDLKLPDLQSGDLVAVLTTGAYHYSMASRYNQVPRPPVYLMQNGDIHTIVEGESYEDLWEHDRVPGFLKGG